MVDVTASSFKEDVLQSDIPVIVDFWAEWCGPCKALAPTIDDLTNEYANKVKILKFDIESDDQKSIPLKYGIRSIPTIIFFKDGEPVHTMTGVPGNAKEEIIKHINEKLL